MPKEFDKTVYDRLSAVAAVTSLVGTRIFFASVPQQTPFPYLILTRISTDPLVSASGVDTSGTENLTFQFDCLAQTYEGAKDLGDAVRTALDTWSTSGGAVEVSPVIPVSEADDMISPAGADGRPIHRSRLDYSMWFSD